CSSPRNHPQHKRQRHNGGPHPSRGYPQSDVTLLYQAVDLTPLTRPHRGANHCFRSSLHAISAGPQKIVRRLAQNGSRWSQQTSVVPWTSSDLGLEALSEFAAEL
ncbi:hypothetical protein BaRGS_00015527, partial [Batillaria attramentaria]